MTRWEQRLLISVGFCFLSYSINYLLYHGNLWILCLWLYHSQWSLCRQHGSHCIIASFFSVNMFRSLIISKRPEVMQEVWSSFFPPHSRVDGNEKSGWKEVATFRKSYGRCGGTGVPGGNTTSVGRARQPSFSAFPCQLLATGWSQYGGGKKNSSSWRASENKDRWVLWTLMYLL